MANPENVPGSTAEVAGWAYAWWLLCGALLGLGIASLLTIGALLLLAAAVLVGIGLRTPRLRNRAAVAVVGGVAVPALYLAWLNRGGPGEVCRTSGTDTACEQAWSPWPFVAAAAVLVGCSALLAYRTRGRR